MLNFVVQCNRQVGENRLNFIESGERQRRNTRKTGENPKGTRASKIGHVHVKMNQIRMKKNKLMDV
jgi:hypothetical protein